MNRLIRIAYCTFCCLFFIPMVSAAEPLKLNIVGATLGGTVNAGYAAFAQAFMKMYPDSNVNIVPGGAVSNPIRMSRKVGELSHTQSIMLRVATSGSEPYKEQYSNLRSLFKLGDEARVHFIVRDDVPFRTLEEIKEKQIPLVLATSPKGTTNELYGRWILEAYGITYEDIKKWGGKINNSAYATVIDMMKNKQVDMLMWVGPGVPMFMQEVALSHKLRWIPVSDAVADKVSQSRGLKKSIIRKDEFSGLIGVDTPCMTDYTEAFTHEDVSDELAYAITKAWMENAASIRAACPGWKDNQPEKVWKNLTLEMHPGAAKYFREAGYMK